MYSIPTFITIDRRCLQSGKVPVSVLWVRMGAPAARALYVYPVSVDLWIGYSGYVGKMVSHQQPAFCAGLYLHFLLEKSHYSTTVICFCWISFVMIFLPAHRQFSADVPAPGAEVRYNALLVFVFFAIPDGVLFLRRNRQTQRRLLPRHSLRQWLEQRNGAPASKFLLKQEWMPFLWLTAVCCWT